MKKICCNIHNFRRGIQFSLLLLGLLSVLASPALLAKQRNNSNILIKSGKAAISLSDRTRQRKGKAQYTSRVSKIAGKQRLFKQQLQSSANARKLTPVYATNAFGFSVYDATVNLITDNDNDGYFSEFALNIDVDFDGGAAAVYAEIYYRTAGGNWLWFDTTDNFQINGQVSSDSYSVISNLTAGFPSEQYDFLIDIYEVNVPGIVVTYSSVDDVDLANVMLEDAGYDSAVNNDLTLQSLSMNLFGDDDHDGFYYSFNLTAEITNQSFDRNLYAILYSRDSTNDWYKEHTTTTVQVNLNETVEFSIDGTWNTGYPTDYYDFLVEIVDADTGEVLVDFGPEYQVLSQKALESSDWDNSMDVIVGSSSGGSFNLSLLMGLILFGMSRKLIKKIVC